MGGELVVFGSAGQSVMGGDGRSLCFSPTSASASESSRRRLRVVCVGLSRCDSHSSIEDLLLYIDGRLSIVNCRFAKGWRGASCGRQPVACRAGEEGRGMVTSSLRFAAAAAREPLLML